MRRAVVALLVAGILAGCGTVSGHGAAGRSSATSVRSPSTSSPATSSPATTAPVAPGTVVLEYYDAVNAHDYQKAWALGGDHLSSNYATYVQGYAGTASVTVSILSTQGNTVQVQIVATEDSGAKATYQGTYTVSNGVIVSANIQGGIQGGTCQLSLTAGPARGATGHFLQVLILTNVGQVACSASGYPGLQFVSGAGQPVPATVNHGGSFTFPAVTPSSFSLSPGAQAAFDLGGADFNGPTGGSCPEATSVEVTPPVTPPAGNVSVRVSVPVCPGGTDESPVVPGSEGPHF
ncbi:MAG: DUF4232 domain-containing protein [Acidimicrobiaceae bacterium]|nr:DUF4232 domain-containing protein [Acidimicrobiaceae bacterium]